PIASRPANPHTPSPPCVIEFSAMVFREHCSNISSPAESCPRLYTPCEYPRTQKSSAFLHTRFPLDRHIASPHPDRNEQSQSYTNESLTRSRMIPFCPRRTRTFRSVTRSAFLIASPAPCCVIHSSLSLLCGNSQSDPSSASVVDF